MVPAPRGLLLINMQPPLSSSFLTREVVEHLEVKSLGLKLHQGDGSVVFVSNILVQLR